MTAQPEPVRMSKEPSAGPVVARPGRVRPDPRQAVAAVRKAAPPVRATGRHAGYGVLGLWRLGATVRGWLVADEYAMHKGAKPEMIERVRDRRRGWALWTGGTCFLGLAAVVRYWWPGLLILAVLALAVASVIERRLRAVDPDSGRKTAGKHPGAKIVRTAAADAKIGKADEMRVVGPVLRDNNIAWTAKLELPPGVTAAQAIKKQPQVAAALGVDLSQLSMDPVRGHAGQVTLWCADSNPLAGPSVPSPLVGRTTAFDVWAERVDVGYDVRGRPVGFHLPERSLLVGGEPGAGKSVGCGNVLCSVALDPRMPMWMVDGKGGADLVDYEPIAARFLADPDPKALLGMIGDAQDDMADRYRGLKSLGEKTLTRDVAEELGVYLAVFHIDELQYFAASDLGKKIVQGLWDLTSRGRAAGWVISCATQRPSGDVIPTYLRDILSIRWALRCTTPEASDTILGRGWAGRGYSAAVIDAEQRGAGLLLSAAVPVTMRTGMLKDRESKTITRQAYKLREQAGTLPRSDARPGVRVLKAVLAAMGERPKMWTRDVLAALAEHEEYAGWDATRLADELRPYGVRPGDQWIEGTNANGYRRTEVMKALERA